MIYGDYVAFSKGDKTFFIRKDVTEARSLFGPPNDSIYEYCADVIIDDGRVVKNRYGRVTALG